ncbi:hypothetical protein WJX72_007268 [[Myrmecia] bisecta]|uniref:Uncharacterized protein n=1 Tax=[Myrmecia] bisecta TaxID=41462 RepID=A0AAW1Q7Q6_9CHLO
MCGLKGATLGFTPGGTTVDNGASTPQRTRNIIIGCVAGALFLLLVLLAYRFRRQWMHGCCHTAKDNQARAVQMMTNDGLFDVASVVYSMTAAGQSPMSVTAPRPKFPFLALTASANSISRQGSYEQVIKTRRMSDMVLNGSDKGVLRSNLAPATPKRQPEEDAGPSTPHKPEDTILAFTPK